jgi:tetratricopeptide (TPR) repeat protein
MNKTSLFSILIILFFHQAYSQDFRRQYKQAKDYFELGKYSEAMDAFKPLMVYDQENPYPEYASFYYALSAHRLGYTSVAKETFLQLKKLYPNWVQLPEVNYWLCKIYFDLGEYFQGLLVASYITDPAFQSGLTDLKRTYLARIDDVETLKMVLEDYPNDPEAARALVRLLGKQPAHLQESDLIDSLCFKYSLSREALVTVEAPKPHFKEKYRIALILPFLAETLDPTPVKKRNQFVLDLYEGMKLAADSIANSGIQLELLAYDNERNKEVTKDLLQKEELKTADLIVGPLFQEESVPVQEFSLANQINLVINPISNNADLANKSPFTFLFQPSHETLGMRSAEWAATHVKREHCLVYYGEAVKDSVMAFNFIKRALELGIKIVYAEEVRNDASGRILETLASATEFDEWKNPIQFKLKKDSIGSIFVASDNELIYSKVINSVETRNDSIIVIGQEGWLQDTSVDFSKFERTRVTMAAPNFRSMTSPAYAAFRKNYLQKHGTLPVEYACIGYEFIMTVGTIFSRFGANFSQTMPDNTFIPGTLGSGYTLLPTDDNGTVPFITFRNGQLVKY